MIKDTRLNGHSGGDEPPVEAPAQLHVVEDIDAASRRVATEDASGAALRSILIGAVLVGGLTFLARVLFRRSAGRAKGARR